MGTSYSISTAADSYYNKDDNNDNDDEKNNSIIKNQHCIRRSLPPPPPLFSSFPSSSFPSSSFLSSSVTMAEPASSSSSSSSSTATTSSFTDISDNDTTSTNNYNEQEEQENFLTSNEEESLANALSTSMMPQYKRPETFDEKLYRKVTSEPLVPIGCGITTYFLLSGIRSFMNRDSKRSQLMMRGRVMAQAFTVCAFCAYAGWDNFQLLKFEKVEEKKGEENSK